MNFSLDLLPDIILILVSGSACLYCGVLNRRLKALHNLKSGVGATIVTLTEAITETNKAAKDAQSSTKDTVETLRKLLIQSDAAAPKLEAKLIELERMCKRAEKYEQTLAADVEDTLKPAVAKARKTAAQILQTLTLCEKYADRQPHPAANSAKSSQEAIHNAPALQAAQDDVGDETNLPKPDLSQSLRLTPQALIRAAS